MFKVPLPEMLVDDILPRKTVTGITAMPGTGKTWLTLELARSISTGTKFLGRFQAKPGNVVYVGQDSSIHDYAQQLRKLIRAEYQEYQADVEKGLRHVNPFDDRLRFIIQPGLLLEDKKSVMRLASTVLSLKHSEYDYIEHRNSFSTGERIGVKQVEYKTGADLIVLDTLSSMLRVDQLDNTSMEIPIRNCRWLAAATGACVVIIHHNSYPSENNDGERWRGAGSQVAALDNWFHIAHTPRGPKGRLLLKCKRFRGLTPPDFTYEMSVDDNKATLLSIDDESPIATISVAGISIDDVLPLLTQEWQPKSTVLDRAEQKMGNLYTAAQIRRAVSTMLDSDSIVEKGPGRVGYRLRMINNGEVNADT